ncbi:hypothetical protein [Oceanobacillus zhaokaii]|uniref:hypothetical protein n=1 Tax=Oceanobacillus zhaokaii TaxID=2052660 RepID=UPI0013B42AC2|nr:hypothetical protein [Oceanobacillus zhaokaii]
MTLDKIIAGLNETPKKKELPFDREGIGNSIHQLNRPILESYNNVFVKEPNKNPAE